MGDEQIKASSPSTTPTQPVFRRDETFVSRYANNFQIQSNAFDLKVVFGVLDQSGAQLLPPDLRAIVDQHTSINLSWPEVKLFIYFLQLHLAGYENENGKVKIASEALPPEPPSNPPKEYDNPKGREAFDMIRKMRKEFVDSLPKL